jgi:hypothetical protein
LQFCCFVLLLLLQYQAFNSRHAFCCEAYQAAWPTLVLAAHRAQQAAILFRAYHIQQICIFGRCLPFLVGPRAYLLYLLAVCNL